MDPELGWLPSPPPELQTLGNAGHGGSHGGSRSTTTTMCSRPIFQGNHSVFRSGPPSAFESQTLVRARTRTERRLNAACCIGWHIPTVMPVELIFLGPAGPSMHGYRKEALPRAEAGSVDRVCVGQSDSPCAPPPRDETSSADCGWPTFTTKRRAWCIERSSPTECVCGTTGH
jgi:hypothetical protein